MIKKRRNRYDKGSSIDNYSDTFDCREEGTLDDPERDGVADGVGEEERLEDLEASVNLFEIYPLENVPFELYPMQDKIRWRFFNGRLTQQETLLVDSVLTHPELHDQILTLINNAEAAALIRRAVSR